VRRESGFTIVEVLISILLLGLVVTAVAVPLLGFNKVNIQSQNSLSANTAAQLQLEGARTYVVSNYTNNALLIPANLGSVKCTNISALDEEMSPAACSLNPNPPMRRLVISQDVTGTPKPKSVILTLDVRP
jgi:prepilin-type N-terminal cleavage/methylation domain-containing protein